MNSPSHHHTSFDGFAARFVAGRLAGEALADFEAHLLECATCQDEVRLGLPVRAASLAGAFPATARTSTRRWRVAAVLGAAAAVALMVAQLGESESSLAPLGAIDAAPLYIGVPVRDESEDAAFDTAMDAYQRGDFATAYARLDALIAAGTSTPPVQFFRGASAMMLQRDGDAIVAFSALVDDQDSPYHDEARYLRAKAYLRRGEADAALADLAAVRDAAWRARADALADSVAAVRVR